MFGKFAVKKDFIVCHVVLCCRLWRITKKNRTQGVGRELTHQSHAWQEGFHGPELSVLVRSHFISLPMSLLLSTLALKEKNFTHHMVVTRIRTLFTHIRLIGLTCPDDWGQIPVHKRTAMAWHWYISSLVSSGSLVHFNKCSWSVSCPILTKEKKSLLTHLTLLQLEFERKEEGDS